MLALAPFLALATPVVGHDAAVKLDVTAQRLEVADKLTLPAEAATFELALHAGLSPTLVGSSAAGTIVKVGTLDAAVPAERWLVTLPARGRVVELSYGGVIAHAPQQVATEYQRSFQETPGVISKDGVYLSIAALWLPRLLADGKPASELVTTAVKVTGLPAGWRALSEGQASGADSWLSVTPCDGAHLIAGPFVEQRERIQGTDVLVWLRSADSALAQRYLDVTGQYLKMYGALIGPYPYPKLAVVENFWETGYGMASFTLLGPQVIRFPFILHTSYPHEILHNWWGNGVFVADEGGNWSEGLTAYLADHLNAEQQGRAVDYRRTTLQKYQDFVGDGADFALNDFTGRTSSASEAVGYGKWLMVVHMLRQRLGERAFIDALRTLWKEHRFDKASFADVRAAFQSQSKDDLSPFFDAWVGRAGAPRVQLREVAQSRTRDGALTLKVAVEQTQAAAPFPLEVPIVVTTVDGKGTKTTVPLLGRSGSVELKLGAAAARVDVDPFVDTFRALLPGETAPSLSRALGARAMTFVLPTLATAEERAAWKGFMLAICGSQASCTAVDDKDVATLPGDRATWILGYGNRLRGAAVVSASRFGANLSDIGFLSPGPFTPERLKAERTEPGKSSLALALAHPKNEQLGVVFVAAHDARAVALLGKKLPHYGKYGWLAFAGDVAKGELDNTQKGQWEPDRSPLTAYLGGERPKIALTSGPPLAKLPPPIEGGRMTALVGALGDPKLGGRAAGSAGFETAMALVERELTAIGVEAAGDGASYRSCVAPRSCNLIGVLRGTDRTLTDVVLGAHLDGLGSVKGKVHPGADDNASGVAALLEAARALKKAGPGLRTVRLIVFTGEESGLVGSRAWVKAQGDLKSKVFAMVNLDTVGRKGDRPLLVLDGASASEWVHVARGVGFTTGIKVELAREGGGSSDQQAFLEAGVPAIQLFSGTHADYHRAGDRADKVEEASLVDAAVVVKEIVGYLADRKDPLSFGAASVGATGGRRAALGSVPDMTFGGPGVKIDDVVAASPAASAGIKKGDVLVRFDGALLSDLRSYSDMLKKKQPGDKVTVVVRRDGKELSFDVVLGER
ncbi:MAG: M20/M25/M40 family metallo-hydrolase [Deltaproteobacteria bacterium]|nr:M20/M25/M40 family metallo-hydrolase [Deltaproteobacteria bacterium]